jgi:hypothetical protein
MKITAVTAMALMVGMGASAEETVPIPETLKNREVISALRTAWMQAKCGTSVVEATFSLDGDRSGYKVVAAARTNEKMSQAIWISRGKTFAVFHVHPSGSRPDPSGNDRVIADKYNVKMVTIHRSGLYEYDPVSRKTAKLREGLDWMSPVENQRGD